MKVWVDHMLGKKLISQIGIAVFISASSIQPLSAAILYACMEEQRNGIDIENYRVLWVSPERYTVAIDFGNSSIESPALQFPRAETVCRTSLYFDSEWKKNNIALHCMNHSGHTFSVEEDSLKFTYANTSTMEDIFIVARGTCETWRGD